MIFIEINVDKIINAFTKIFFLNVVNVYHIYAIGHGPVGLCGNPALVLLKVITAVWL